MGEPVTTGAGGGDVSPDSVTPMIGVPDSVTPPVPGVLGTDPPAPIIPRDGFHDTREIAAAEAGQLPTSAGYPLHPAAKEVLQGVRQAIDGMRSWADWAEAQLNKAAAIGSGH